MGSENPRAGDPSEDVRSASGGVGPASEAGIQATEQSPLWVLREEFLDLLAVHASPFGAGQTVWSVAEPWVSVLRNAAYDPTHLLSELPDWAALIDRHSTVSVECEGPDAIVVWKNESAGWEATPSECAFRAGAISGLLSGEGDPPLAIEHRSCEARGDPDCEFVVASILPVADSRHAGVLRESSILASSLEGREAIFRRLSVLSPRHGAFPDVRGLRAVRRFMEEVEDPVLIIARDASVLDANSAASELSGFNIHELRGLSARDLLTPESFRALNRFLPLLFEEGSLHQAQLKLGVSNPLQLEVRSRHGVVPVELSMRATENGDTLVCIARDVRERLRLERELEDRNRQLEVQNERISEADRLKSEFLANVSHELTTPLACIKGFAKLLWQDREASRSGAHAQSEPEEEARDGTLDPAQREEFLSIIQLEAERMTHLIRGLLELSKIESGVVSLDRAQVSLNAIVRESVLVLKPRLDERELDADCSLDESLPLASLDPDLIKQVVLNLLDNAIKFSPPGSTIGIRTAASGGRIRLAIRNPSADLDGMEGARIFERFVQRDGSFSRQYGGVGLGLNLVRAILEMHGGGIRLELGEPGVVEFVSELPA